MVEESDLYTYHNEGTCYGVGSHECEGSLSCRCCGRPFRKGVVYRTAIQGDLQSMLQVNHGSKQQMAGPHQPPQATFQV